MNRLHPAALALGALWTSGPLLANPPVPLAPVTVTATRIATPNELVPAAISRLEAPEAGLGVNLTEALSGVPGLVARDRQNYAQDSQISLRGFGARASFGIRGLRLYLDGIPASQPDGQGQVSHFPVTEAAHIEVLRGPFSALYGNSSGGVIQLFTVDGGPQPLSRVEGLAGGEGRWRGALSLRGPLDEGAETGDFSLSYSRFETEGYRAHSASRRELVNGKLRLRLGDDRRLSLLLNHFDSPESLDPLGLSRAQAESDPSQAAPVALSFNTRKRSAQTQAGAVYGQDLAGGRLQLLGYGGRREVQQVLAIPVAAQAAPGSAGGLVDLGSDYAGGDLRWSWQGRWQDAPLALVGGLAYERLDQQRQGYENFVGGQLGVRGALRRDELNRVDSVDQYLQADWRFAPRWGLSAGLRQSRVGFVSEDRYIRARNPDDSGRRSYRATTPVAGLRYALRPWAQLYGAWGSGFETPTFAELAYRPDGSPGLNLGLEASRSRSLELGAKLNPRPGLRSELALFETRSEDELVVATNSGGRSSFANAGHSRRRGIEWLLEAQLAEAWQLQLAGSWLSARLREDYLACGAPPCTSPNVQVAAGSRLAGVPEQQWQTRLIWTPAPGWRGFAELRYLDAVPVNDLNSESAPAYALVDLGGRYRRDQGRWSWSLWARAENLLDRRYIGSVIVNDGNGRYYEPGPGRSLLTGLTLEFR